MFIVIEKNTKQPYNFWSRIFYFVYAAILIFNIKSIICIDFILNRKLNNTYIRLLLQLQIDGNLESKENCNCFFYNKISQSNKNLTIAPFVQTTKSRKWENKLKIIESVKRKHNKTLIQVHYRLSMT